MMRKNTKYDSDHLHAWLNKNQKSKPEAGCNVYMVWRGSNKVLGNKWYQYQLWVYNLMADFSFVAV